MKLTKRGETVKYWLYALAFIAGISIPFFLDAWLFGGSI